MNQIEMAAQARTQGMRALQVMGVETPAKQPVAGTPTVFFAAAGFGYLVARAFGPADAVEAIAFQDQMAEADLDGLLGLREAAL